MTPAFHLLVPFIHIRRIGGIAGFMLLAGMGGTIWATIALDLPKEIGLVAAGGLLIGMLGKEALPMLKPGLAVTDGLLISTNGLAFTRKGRTVEWRWDEISELQVRSRLHPASLILGKFISFRVPRDERRRAPGIGRSLWLGGNVVAIADNYPGRPVDLLRQMEHYRDNAAAGQRAASSRPEAGWSFRKDRKKPKLGHLLLAVGGPVIGMAVGWIIIGTFPESIEEFLDEPGIISGLAPALAMLPLILVMQFRFEAKQDNMLMMGAGGLHTRAKIESRFWMWRDIIDMQVTHSASRGKDGSVERIVSFTATHDGSKPGKEVSESETLVPVSCSIEDNYETPVEEIAQQARIWWEWSGATFGHPVAAEASSRRSAFASRETSAVSYRKALGGAMSGRNSLLDQIVPFILLLPMLTYTGVTIWMLKADIHLDLLPWWLDLAGMAVLVFGSVIGMIAVIQPGLNRLELTEEGLLHVRYGFKRRRAWHEIGAVELRRLRTRWSAKQRSVVTLETDARGWTSGLLRWAFNIDQHRRAVIEDMYDSSLDEIAEALNAHRRKHGGRAPQGASN